MAVLYRITGWADHFENNRTRELKHMDWVPLPNKHDGDGYTELVSHPDGAAHFGAWVAIVQVASKCRPRGTLVRTIPQEGAGLSQEGAQGLRPHDPASLSRITRIPVEVFAAAIPRLVAIGWLAPEVVASSTDTTIPQEGAGIPQEGAAKSHPTDYGTEGNGREGKPLSADADAADPDKADPAKTPGASDAGKAGAGKTAKTKPKGDKPEHAEVRDYFRERWKAVRGKGGADYPWKFSRDDKHLQWILDQVGRDAARAKDIVAAFVRDDDPWLCDRGHDFALLVSRFAKYRARPREAADPDNGTGFVRRELSDTEADELLRGVIQ